MAETPGWHSREGSDTSQLYPATPELIAARQVAAALYPPGGIAARAILSGQWDGGRVVKDFLMERPLESD